jgi:hypothetical protein
MPRTQYYRRIDGNIVYHFICNLYTDVDKNACTKKNLLENDLKDALYYCIEKQIKLAVDTERIVQEIKKEQKHKKQNNTLDKKINE